MCVDLQHQILILILQRLFELKFSSIFADSHLMSNIRFANPSGVIRTIL